MRIFEGEEQSRKPLAGFASSRRLAFVAPGRSQQRAAASSARRRDGPKRSRRQQPRAGIAFLRTGLARAYGQLSFPGGGSMSAAVDPGAEKKSVLMQAAMLGSMRGVLGLIIEHPWDCIKTKHQAFVSGHLAEYARGVATAPTAVAIARKIVRDEGIMGFYKGFVPNATRVISKQAYRYPVMIALPTLVSKFMPESLRAFSFEKIATGIALASFEAFFITPLERLKVFVMTGNGGSHPVLRFFEFHSKRGHAVTELFRGVNVVHARQLASWISYLVAEDRVKKWSRAVLPSGPDGELSPPSLLACGAVVGLVNTAATMPFDFVKTAAQRCDAPLEVRSVFGAIREAARTNGVGVLYTGWRVRMCQYMIQAAVTVSLIDQLERMWRRASEAGEGGSAPAASGGR
eukprot:tig00000441_g709.t1